MGLIMSNSYISYFSISDGVPETVSRIMGNLIWLSKFSELGVLPNVCKHNRIKAVRASLAIENKRITIEHVADVLSGKKVDIPQGDINKIYNTFSAYGRLAEVDPCSVADLLRVHRIMYGGQDAGAGSLRTEDGVICNSGGEIIHLAPPCEFVTEELEKLFDWVKNDRTNMLAKASVCHYELQFIQPFNAGNFRMAMLWQSALLCSWNPIFEWIPVESVIESRRELYYRVIAESVSNCDSGAFIRFMIGAIDIAVRMVVSDVEDFIDKLNGRRPNGWRR